MNLPFGLPIKRRGEGQGGAASPFMFGLLIGVSIFSVLSAYWGQRELVKLQERQLARAKMQADDVAKALEFSVLTETHESYSEQFDMNRARGSLAYATGRTRGGQEYIVNTQDADEETFGSRNRNVAITTTDDTLLRAKVYQAGGAEGIRALEGQNALATMDTGGIRQRQVLTSVRKMEAMAEQIYAFYAGNMRFPTDLEYRQLQQKFPYVDAWGGPFAYTRLGNDTGRLEFTTPWQYTQSLNLSLKE